MRAIRADEFEGGRLPPESELARRLGVSRTTLRTVLQALEAEGLVSRRRRHGTVVNAHLLRSSMRLNHLVGFIDLIEQSGHTASVHTRARSVQHAAPETAASLGIEPDAPCLVVERVLCASEVAAITVLDTVPLEVLDRDPDAVVDADSTFAFLAANGASPAAHAATEIVPRIAGDGQPEGLALADGTPYVQLLEVVYSADHDPLAVSHVSVDDSIVRLSLLRRDR